MAVASSESSSAPKQSSSESARRTDGENRDATHPAEESPGLSQVEQSVALAPEFEATESRPRTELLRALSRGSSDAFEASHAVEELRATIEEAVRRGVGALGRQVNAQFEVVEAKFDGLRNEMNSKFEVVEAKFDSLRNEMNSKFEAVEAKFKSLRNEMNSKFEAVEAKFDGLRSEMNSKFEAIEAKFESLRNEMNAKFESLRSEMNARFEALESQIRMLRWMVGVSITLLVAIFVLLAKLAFAEDRLATPLPPPQTLAAQEPAETETAPPTGTVRGSEAPALAAPGEPSAKADTPADQSTP